MSQIPHRARKVHANQIGDDVESIRAEERVCAAVVVHDNPWRAKRLEMQ